jgi:hypothetical protein
MGGRDFLGLQSVGDSMLDRLLPGLTNQTRHPRYYAFFCWVFAHAHKLGVTERKLNDFTFLFESAMVLSVAAKHGADIRGVIGITRATKGTHRWLGEQKNYRLDNASWSHRPSALDPAAYGPSFDRLGLTQRTGRRKLVLTERGLRLADIYGANLDRRTWLMALEESTKVKGTALSRGHGDLCPCSIRPPERDQLREMLFRMDSPPSEAAHSEHRNRRLTLALVLDLVRQGHGQLSRDDNDLRTLLYFWQYPDGSKYTPPEALTGVALSWRLFQARQYQRFAIEALWAAYLRLMAERRTMPFSARAVASSMLAAVDDSDALASLGILARDSDRLTLGSLAEALLRRPGQWNAKSKGAENQLKVHIDRCLADGANAEAFCIALVLLLVIWRRWKDADEPALGKGFLRKGGRSRLSLAALFEECDRQKETSLTEFCAWAITELVTGQHLSVAANKLRREGINTFWFSAEEDGYTVQPSRDVLRAKPGYNAPKLRAALSCLSDLRLVKRRDDGGHQISRDGERLLKAVLTRESERTTDANAQAT